MKRYLLQALHNCVAHPLLGVLGYPAPDWAVRFHDWTAELAWPGHIKYVDRTERYDVPEETPPKPEDVADGQQSLCEAIDAAMRAWRDDPRRIHSTYTYAPGPHVGYHKPTTQTAPDAEVIVTSVTNPNPGAEGAR